MIRELFTSPVAYHLWQSTVFAALAALLALVLRNNSARVRYGVYFAASMKFLIPFAPIVALGSMLSRRAAPVIARPVLSMQMERIGRVFDPGFIALTPPNSHPASANLLPAILWTIWACGFIAVSARWFAQWTIVRSAARAGRPIGAEAGTPVRSCSALLEPGVFGIFRPVMLLPEGIAEHLSAAELRAVIAHELCHVRRRDNLLAAMHMLVEAIFWFYPVVWWIGSRLVEERERACDEEVVGTSGEPLVYAESILRTCRYYLESPVACVSGVTGADLKARIARIMSECAPRRLGYTKRALLAGAAVVAIAAPVMSGLAAKARAAQAPVADTSGQRESFEVASIKPGDPADRRVMVRLQPGGRLTTANVPVIMLIRQAYDVQDFQITGAPDWVKTERWNTEAKMSGAGDIDQRKMTVEQMQAFSKRVQACMQSLLEDRFGLKLHRETKVMPVYALVVAKGGPKLTEVEKPGPGNPRQIRMGRGELMGTAVQLSDLAKSLGERVGRPVEDRTSLKGFYDYKLNWTPDPAEMMLAPGPPAGPDAQPAPDPNGPSLMTALQEQLGLKLEPAKGPVEVLVIDHIERPSAN